MRCVYIPHIIKESNVELIFVYYILFIDSALCRISFNLCGTDTICVTTITFSVNTCDGNIWLNTFSHGH